MSKIAVIRAMVESELTPNIETLDAIEESEKESTLTIYDAKEYIKMMRSKVIQK